MVFKSSYIAVLLAALGCRSLHAFAPSYNYIIQTQSPSSLNRIHRDALLSPARTHDTRLTTRESDIVDEKKTGPFRKAMNKFKARPGTYMIIPCVAALVGWFTNYLAVQMIFYPIKFRGLPIYQKPEVPLGLVGWQGIVPCKTRPMSIAMVNMVTSQLLSVQQVFKRLDPRRVATLLAPEVPKLGQEVVTDIVSSSTSIMPSFLAGIPGAVVRGLPKETKSVLAHLNFKFLHDLTVDLQTNINSVLNLENCVVQQMLQDRTLLGQLFRKCGQKELDFLTNSGLWFGFLLGLIQMVVALFWDNPWSLSIGGGIVGLATNWLALKWIFEPVNPTKVGPFVLQGQFLRRQKEVSKEFSKFFAQNVLTSEKVWHSILTDPETSPAFAKMFTKHFTKFTTTVTNGLRLTLEPQVIALAAGKALEKLPQHLSVLHEYVDDTLGLQETLRVKMEQMSSSQFERVLHPIFEEDELTLILAGAALGFAAGLIQQGLETGKIKLPNITRLFQTMRKRLHSSKLRKKANAKVQALKSRLASALERIRRRRKTSTSSSFEGIDVVNGEGSGKEMNVSEEVDVEEKKQEESEATNEKPSE